MSQCSNCKNLIDEPYRQAVIKVARQIQDTL